MSKGKKTALSTYDRLIQEDPQFKVDLDEQYKELVLSDLLIAMMEQDHISVRKLAQEASVSPSLIQDLKTGKKENLTFNSFHSITDALGYDLVLHKREARATSKIKIAPIKKKPATKRKISR